MRKWFLPFLAVVLTSGVGIAINVATDLGSSVLAWVAVGVLTLAAGVVAVVTLPVSSDKDSVNSTISGTVHGSVVQARDISAPITFSSDRSSAPTEHPKPDGADISIERKGTP